MVLLVDRDDVVVSKFIVSANGGDYLNVILVLLVLAGADWVPRPSFDVLVMVSFSEISMMSPVPIEDLRAGGLRIGFWRRVSHRLSAFAADFLLLVP